MSYQVLARKWRPQRFGDMIGQEHVLKALVNALNTDRLHHAYLFTGMRGVGKTTIARIFAKCLNCERAEGVTSEPCGECGTCQDIEAGRFFDLIEVDAASRTKVDETRELLENVPYAPTSGRFKVYLIDEVHMFSTHSFNALLKTLEEPPEHVKFLLATTDPQKVPVTVLSRCLQFNLKRMVPARLADYLEKILDEESISHERGALDLIARAADGSVRDSLSLVEQAAAYGEGAVRVLDVESMLGRVSVARLLAVLDALAAADTNTVFSRVNELAQYAPDYHELLGELLSLIHRIALLQSVPDSIEADATERDTLEALASRISAEETQLWYQIGMHARRDMPFAPDPREAFDMAMLRMLAFKPQGPSESTTPTPVPGNAAKVPVQAAASLTVASVASGPSGVSQAAIPTDVKPSTPPSADAAVLSTSATSASASEHNASAPSATTSENSASDHADSNTDNETNVSSIDDRMAQLDAALGRAPKKKVATEPVRSSTTKASVSATAAIDAHIDKGANEQSSHKVDASAHEPLVLDNDHWPEIIRKTKLAGLPLQLAMNSAVKSWDGGVLGIELPMAAQHLQKPATIQALGEQLSGLMGEAVKVMVSATKSPIVTPTLLVQQAAQQAQKNAELSIQNDPLLAELLSRVDGEVTKNSVRPAKNPTELTSNNGET